MSITGKLPADASDRAQVRATAAWRLPILHRITGQAAASAFEVAEADVASATRGSSHVALARQVAMYLAHVVGGMSLTEVGRMYRRDRTTVAHACAVVEDRRDDPRFDRAMSALEFAVRRLGGKLLGGSCDAGPESELTADCCRGLAIGVPGAGGDE